MKDLLMSIGLSAHEAQIYLALLETGPALVSTIVDKTRINRTHIYDRLNALITKGLAAYVIKSNRKFFHAAEPDRLLRYLDEKEAKLSSQKEEVKKSILILEKIKPSKEEDTTEIYEGKEGLKTILEDIIKSKKDVYTYGSRGNFTNVLTYYFKHYLTRLQKTGIKMQVVFNADEKQKDFNWKFAKARYLPKEFQTPTETTIYGNKVAIFILTGKPNAILMNSKTIAEAYHKYFGVLWKTAK